jgi:hypothetical protein
MTILSFVLQEDCVLLGADSGVLAMETMPFRQPFPGVIPDEDKFYATGAKSIMWGFSGQAIVAAPIVKFMTGRTWANWVELERDVIGIYQETIRDAKRSVSDSGGDPDHPALALEMVVAGYLQGELGVFLMCPPGLHLEVDVDAAEKNIPHCLGGGQSLGLAAWSLLSAYHPDSAIHTTEDFRTFLEAVCRVGAGLEPPAHIWRVTPGGADLVPRPEGAGSKWG